MIKQTVHNTRRVFTSDQYAIDLFSVNGNEYIYKSPFDNIIKITRNIKPDW
jgi:hypothetical protein